MTAGRKILAGLAVATALVLPWACRSSNPVRLGGFGGSPAPTTATTTRGVVPEARFAADGPVQDDGLPKPWQSRVIVGQLQVGVVDGPATGERALRVRCDHSHIVLTCPAAAPFDPAAVPVFTWSWRADALPARGDSRTHGAVPVFGDNRNDKGLQVMVAFEGNDVLNYVWDVNAPVGYECNEFSPVATVKTRVVETGPPAPGQWRAERVDVVADYVRRFGHRPGKVIGIGISANTNHTSSVSDGAVGPVDAVAR